MKIISVYLDLLKNNQSFISCLPHGPDKMVKDYIVGDGTLPGRVNLSNPLTSVKEFTLPDRVYPGPCDFPIAIDNDGNIVIADCSRKEVVGVSPVTKEVVYTFGVQGITDVAIGPHGYIYVADIIHQTIQAFRLDGATPTVIHTWQNCRSPKSLTVCNDGSVLAVCYEMRANIGHRGINGTSVVRRFVPDQPDPVPFYTPQCAQPVAVRIDPVTQTTAISDNLGAVCFYTPTGGFLYKLENLGRSPIAKRVTFDAVGNMAVNDGEGGVRLFNSHRDELQLIPGHTGSNVAIDHYGHLVILGYNCNCNSTKYTLTISVWR